MVLSQQAQRNWRMAAIVGSVGVAGYGVLVAEYSFPGREEEDHVFTHVQATFRSALDQYVYGIVPGTTRNATDTASTALEQQQQQQQQSSSNTKQQRER